MRTEHITYTKSICSFYCTHAGHIRLCSPIMRKLIYVYRKHVQNTEQPIMPLPTSAFCSGSYAVVCFHRHGRQQHTAEDTQRSSNRAMIFFAESQRLIKAQVSMPQSLHRLLHSGSGNATMPQTTGTYYAILLCTLIWRRRLETAPNRIDRTLFLCTASMLCKCVAASSPPPTRVQEMLLPIFVFRVLRLLMMMGQRWWWWSPDTRNLLLHTRARSGIPSIQYVSWILIDYTLCSLYGTMLIWSYITPRLCTRGCANVPIN